MCMLLVLSLANTKVIHIKKAEILINTPIIFVDPNNPDTNS